MKIFNNTYVVWVFADGDAEDLVHHLGDQRLCQLYTHVLKLQHTYTVLVIIKFLAVPVN